MRQVLIGIQCRFDSKRLPGKALELVGDKTILERVMDSCFFAQKYLNKDKFKLNAEVSTMLLIPEGDPIKDKYLSSVLILQGSNEDVLSRYVDAADKVNADYIVRITADCVFIPSHIIAKHIKTALIQQRDLTTNCLVRTFKEGWDVQVFSRRLLQWLDTHKEPSYREHVGMQLNNYRNFPFKHEDGKPSICHIINIEDESDIHTSIDTPEDLERARKVYSIFSAKKAEAKRSGTFIL